MDLRSHDKLVKALEKFFHKKDPSTHIIQTHISSVILSGKYAYKIKKPVDFGFLDYSTLEKRRYFCHEEIRLNGRFAPMLYLDVVKITGSLDKPKVAALDDPGEPLEFAVKMLRFDDKLLLINLCRKNIDPPKFSKVIDALAENIAHFHLDAAKADLQSVYGTPDLIMKPIRDNFIHIRQYLRGDKELDKSLDLIESWSEKQFYLLSPIIKERKQKGFVRECHGDMHLGNMVLYHDKPILFDGIEFNQPFKWIDVISDLAFTIIDLDAMGLGNFSNSLLNRYLEITGDYASLRFLRFYQCYRAMVRVKIAALRLGQENLSTKEREYCLDTIRDYIKLAQSYMKPPQCFIVIMYGLSGSGKSVCAKNLAQKRGAIVIRSDTERKRLFGSVSLKQRYSPQTTMVVYKHLGTLARRIIESGIPVIVDATFLQKRYRDIFINLAKNLSQNIKIIHTVCPEELIRERLANRNSLHKDPSEADEAVLDIQIKNIKPLEEGEKEISFIIDTSTTESMESSLKQLNLSL